MRDDLRILQKYVANKSASCIPALAKAYCCCRRNWNWLINLGIRLFVLTLYDYFWKCWYMAIRLFNFMIAVNLNQIIDHYSDVIMGTMASQITSLTVVYSIVCSDADQRKHQSSASLAFVLGIHRRPVNSPHKRPVTRKMFPFDEVVM